MPEPTVFIVDDDPDMRDSLQWLLKTVGLRVEAFSSADEFLRGFSPQGAGCLVFDVRMPGTSGLDLYESLVARGLQMPVLFITAYADVPMAIRALKSGAVEFIEKPFNRHTLLEKVQRAIKDDTERLRQKTERESVRARFARLTDKEREVLGMVKDGMPNKAMAQHLEISARAVEMRRANLMKKLDVHSLVELMRLTFAYEDAASNGKP